MNKKDRMLMARAFEQCTDKAARAIDRASVAQREIIKRQMTLQREELETRDRVDLSLKEYERMKERLRELEAKNHKYEEMLSKFCFPLDLEIEPGSIRASYSESIMSDPLKKSFTCRISFLTMKEPVW